jgi:hypothetical protein
MNKIKIVRHISFAGFFSTVCRTMVILIIIVARTDGFGFPEGAPQGLSNRCDVIVLQRKITFKEKVETFIVILYILLKNPVKFCD